MQFEIKRDCVTGSVSFKGAISVHDLADLRMDKMALALLSDVGGDSKATSADYLLALEMLYRRHAEQRPNTR